MANRAGTPRGTASPRVSLAFRPPCLQVLIEHRTGPAGGLLNWQELEEECNRHTGWQLDPASGIRRVQCRCAGGGRPAASTPRALPRHRPQRHPLSVLPLPAALRGSSPCASAEHLLPLCQLPVRALAPPPPCRHGHPAATPPYPTPTRLPALCRAASFSTEDPRLDLAAARSADALVAVRGPACVQWLGMRPGAALLELRRARWAVLGRVCGLSAGRACPAADCEAAGSASGSHVAQYLCIVWHSR